MAYEILGGLDFKRVLFLFPRGSLALLLVARALAVLDGRDAVLPEDVKAVAVPALAHRLTLRPETWATATPPASVARERSEERRVGQECRSRRAPYHSTQIP